MHNVRHTRATSQRQMHNANCTMLNTQCTRAQYTKTTAQGNNKYKYIDICKGKCTRQKQTQLQMHTAMGTCRRNGCFCSHLHWVFVRRLDLNGAICWWWCCILTTRQTLKTNMNYTWGVAVLQTSHNSCWWITQQQIMWQHAQCNNTCTWTAQPWGVAASSQQDKH